MSLCSCRKTPAVFLSQNKLYYSSVAKACDDLIARTNQSSEESIIIQGNDQDLPKVLQDLHATKIKVANNFLVNGTKVQGVVIIFGSGRPDYAISWHQNDVGNKGSPWELLVNTGSDQRAVFTRAPVQTNR
jgi:sRNA-binding regulator protein Hfq